jgi:hypothetical protein
VEAWCVSRMETWYRKSMAIKCPFFRRRASDILDAVDMVMRFVVIRHKSLDLLGPPPAWGCQGKQCIKAYGLSIEETAAIIRKDWREDTKKSYYITGKLNTTIYRDDCFFDGVSFLFSKCLIMPRFSATLEPKALHGSWNVPQCVL